MNARHWNFIKLCRVDMELVFSFSGNDSIIIVLLATLQDKLNCILVGSLGRVEDNSNT